ncbi:predicted protein [Theileria orientalis strain Shintoku]|uniref:Uncharacterized protein n=1 Tax=Theileria orientalis strain Shintoku TaxID=869250 RepID=J4C2N0_THEOR|nr:predicted protein [Theileria orientalis strain Shintoku]BAM38976.1 predicted protein [Theileria orientalis strain Shintoku]|eukprot:XP_009689277.1 predicted protein [Theileria orientalis strain Shintoku]
MNIGLLSWCKILSLVLLCRLYVAACDHSGSTENSNSQDEGARPIYSSNRNNSNSYGGESKIIYPDRIDSQNRPRDSYRSPKRRYRTGTSRKITDYRYLDNPKMQVQNDEENRHSSHRRERYDSHYTSARSRYEPRMSPVRSRYDPRSTYGSHRYDSHSTDGGTRYDPRMNYLSNKVLMILDLNNTQNPYGYDVKFDGNKTICKSIHPYLFGSVQRGSTILWRSKTGDYPYKVVCKTVDGTDTCKVYFPDYERNIPPARPTRVDVFRRVGDTKFGSEYMAAQVTSGTHDHLGPEMYGQWGQFMGPKHIPTGENQPTPHTSLNVKPDETSVPPDEAAAGDESAAGKPPVDGSAQAQGELAAEDVKKAEGDGMKADVPSAGPGARPSAMPGVWPAAMPGAIPYPMPGFVPGYRPGETEPVSHVEMMSDYFNQSYGPYRRPEFQPVPGYNLPHQSHHHHRSAQTDYHQEPFFHSDPLYDDNYSDNQDYIEFTDYSNPAYPQRPDPMIIDPSGRTGFRSHFAPRDVVVSTDQDRQGAFDVNVDRKKRENLVLTFANKSNVYVLDGYQHSFALNQSNSESGTNDQVSANNANQQIRFNTQDPNRVTLDAGSVRMTFPAQVIDGVPLPTGVQPARSTTQANSNVINDAQNAQASSSAQNQRPAAGASTSANASSQQAPTPQGGNQQPVSIPAPTQQAIRPQPVPQQTPRPQPASQPVTPRPATQSVTPKPATQSVTPKPAGPTQPPARQAAGSSQAQASEGAGSDGDIIFADD